MKTPKREVQSLGRWAILAPEALKFIIAWGREKGMPKDVGFFPFDLFFDVALNPELMSRPESESLRNSFFLFYRRAPDFTLSLIQALRRRWESESGKDIVERFLRMNDGCPGMKDNEIVFEIKKDFGKKVSCETVKKSRQRLARLDSSATTIYSKKGLPIFRHNENKGTKGAK